MLTLLFDARRSHTAYRLFCAPASRPSRGLRGSSLKGRGCRAGCRASCRARPPILFLRHSFISASRTKRTGLAHLLRALVLATWRDALKCEGRNEGRLTLAGNIPPTRTRTGRGPPTRGSQSSRQTGVGRRPQVAALCPPSPRALTLRQLHSGSVRTFFVRIVFT